uniref:Transmembrane protein 14C n=1 Tax=Pavo cristatus TaxID=9049 RepID=A0A8C9EIL9_PAVCR
MQEYLNMILGSGQHGLQILKDTPTLFPTRVYNNECPFFLLFIVFYKTSNEFVLELPINVSSFLYSGSVPSLAAGLLFGSLAGLGAYQLSQNPSNVWISLITSGTLTAIMGTRFYNSGKFMPAGLIAGVSLLMVGRLALKMVEKPHEK